MPGFLMPHDGFAIQLVDIIAIASHMKKLALPLPPLRAVGAAAAAEPSTVCHLAKRKRGSGGGEVEASLSVSADGRTDGSV